MPLQLCQCDVVAMFVLYYDLLVLSVSSTTLFQNVVQNLVHDYPQRDLTHKCVLVLVPVLFQSTAYVHGTDDHFRVVSITGLGPNAKPFQPM